MQRCHLNLCRITAICEIRACSCVVFFFLIPPPNLVIVTAHLFQPVCTQVFSLGCQSYQSEANNVMLNKSQTSLQLYETLERTCFHNCQVSRESFFFSLPIYSAYLFNIYSERSPARCASRTLRKNTGKKIKNRETCETVRRQLLLSWCFCSRSGRAPARGRREWCAAFLSNPAPVRPAQPFVNADVWA